MKDFKKSIMGGACISLGVFVYLITLQKTNNIFISAAVFYLGLSLILIFNQGLFTGQVLSLKVSHYGEIHNFSSHITNKLYIKQLSLTLLGNLIGSIITTILLAQILHPDVSKLVASKLSLTPLQMLISAFFCNALVCCAVDNYRTSKNHIISWFFITIFVLMGFEHSIANMSYFTLGFVSEVHMDIIKVLISLALVTLGNVLGGLLVYSFKNE